MNDDILSSSTRFSYSATRAFDRRVVVERVAQHFVDRLVHPVFVLAVAVVAEIAVGLDVVEELLDAFPYLFEPRRGHGRAGVYFGPPARFGHGEQPQCPLELGLGQFGLVDVLAVGLVMTMMSAISMMPRLMPCNSSPAPEICNSMNMSTIECTAVSDCPTPTVSMNTTSKPAASHRTIVSRVLRATPPSDPAEGRDG